MYCTKKEGHAYVYTAQREPPEKAEAINSQNYKITTHKSPADPNAF